MTRETERTSARSVDVIDLGGIDRTIGRVGSIRDLRRSSQLPQELED